ncbi:AraC family transcriptional regulator [Mesorhizobium plurifarium]|uniref:helix-turn-helix domain-containing protein n=1 Tax=Sinorhizobium arboris TaxID=76745 RepID=UPI0004068E2C|nr:AraC family transcriptional regulator [Sinorhizobium arboris]PST18403.1 AraC family transcriptional regulator [Mesorhizobium plurifarium]PST18840.1 AraC family transcriptional regulator [Mesorhizobium plurifarium]
MPSIPLPFVISLLLCLILVRMFRQGEGKLGLFHLLVATFAAQAILSGLNWNVGWRPARSIQPIVAAVLPAMSFGAFDQLRRNRLARRTDILPHLVPAGLVATLVAFWRAPVDIVLFAIYLGYGLALLRVAGQGPGALSAVRISDEWTAHRALIAMAVMLVATAFIDAIVSLDFVFGGGEQARTIVTVASVSWLAVASYAATVADNTRPDHEANTTAEEFASSSSALPASPSIEDDKAIASRVDALMREQHLYRDPDLTLDRLARRVGIPGRQISGALNRTYGRNISQVVNEYRVSDAKRRLVATRDPVTTIMLESGFGTKSNFNREFSRVTGMTPSSYRRAGCEISAAPDARAEVPAS